MNRNILKIIAVVSMLADHIGKVFFPTLIIFRIIGRLAFPIFAFFISEGFVYTKNFKRYLLIITIFAIISTAPYLMLLKIRFVFNILFTFALSLLLLKLIDDAKKSDNQQKIINAFFIFILLVFVLVMDLGGFLEYGIIGVILPAVFYLLRDKKPYMLLTFALLMLILTAKDVLLVGSFTFAACIQIFSVFAILPIMFYNGKKGKLNLKYLFYIFYPLHLTILLFIKLL